MGNDVNHQNYLATNCNLYARKPESCITDV